MAPCLRSPTTPSDHETARVYHRTRSLALERAQHWAPQSEFPLPNYNCEYFFTESLDLGLGEGLACEDLFDLFVNIAMVTA